MEEEISLLKQTIKLDAEKLALELNEKFSYLEKEYVLLKKLLRISITLSITSLAVIIATLFFYSNGIKHTDHYIGRTMPALKFYLKVA